ncbi:uncharacterized protein LOC121260832 isoform X2 [Juglans microcarpa x Juglans regia]|uniref:uncharacterized protein LOC121260832 isoform X2 n=1 Tax=Juglans microcarpa x Juglans regia TaxID=2249226 RepID=UPI001B7E003E|nr:uncharacterized protein LOC121260832 isoform X2 [Juglans microcarpa x Juglans regia]
MQPPGEETSRRCACFDGENCCFHGDHDRSSDPNCQHCGKSDRSSSYSYSSPALDSILLTDSEKLRRIFIASAKGFAIGAGLKGGLALFSILARLRRRKVLTSLRTARWRALVAGAVAGPSMLLTGLNTQHTSLAMYILLRAAVLASRCGIKSKRFWQICKPLTWSHGDIFLMCLSSSQILSAYILKQESLPPSYKSFLNKHGGKDSIILEGVKQIASGMPLTNLEEIEKYFKAMGTDIKLDPKMKVPCSIIHANQSCSSHVLSFFLQAYKRALPVYLPVYLIPALIVHRQGLLKRPYTILGKGLLGTARSSLFLSAYCSSAWMWTCLLFRIFKRCNIPMVAMGTFPTGLALAIEKKSRRMEISLYCLARAIESFFTCMAEAGYLPQSKNLKRADVVIFSLSTAIIMHCYSQEREVFRSKYLNVLDWVFGVPPPPCETPRCKNS